MMTNEQWDAISELSHTINLAIPESTGTEIVLNTLLTLVIK